MVHSAISSEPLTSPTPSPPPPSPPPKPSSTASARATGFESGSELSELSDDEGNQPLNGDGDGDEKSGSTRIRSRRKRGGVVPGDMWDWAYKTKKAAREAQEIDEHEAENDEPRPEMDIQKAGVAGANPSIPESVLPLAQHQGQMHGPLQRQDQDQDQGQELAERAEEPDQDMEQDHGEDEDDEQDRDKDDHKHEPVEDGFQTVPAGVITEDDQGKGEDDMEIDSSEENPRNLALASSHSGPSDHLPQLPDDDGHSETDIEQAAEESAFPPHEDEDEDIASSRPTSPNTDIEIDDAPLPLSPSKPGPSSSLAAPLTVPVPVMHADEESSERSPSPEAEDAPPEADPEVEAEQDEEVVENEEPEEPEEPDIEEPEAKPEADGDADADPDVEAATATPEPSSRSPTPEPDLLDLQPAHRAEALDALALIELKFALLRERLYVEKMEELVQEEGMVISGTHPELLHLQLELSTRRDKRLELAARRRAFEEASVRTKRRDDQNGVWEWWKYERDTLQTDLVAYHNRKRRKLERQRRAHERTQPFRRVPPPPPPRTLPAAPPLAAVLDFNLRAPYSAAYPMRPTRPSLSLLSPVEVESDLGYITGGKRRFWTVDGPGGTLGVTEGLVSFPNGSTSGISELSTRDVKERERERERTQRPPSSFEPTPGPHFRPLPMNAFAAEDASINGWTKRQLEEDARGERERDRERERERERTGQRQAILPLHSHPHPHHTIQHQLPSHTHGLHPFSHTHQHQHSSHLHPHPHHHHVHVHHHHHTGPGSAPGSTAPSPSNAPPPRRAPDLPFPPSMHLNNHVDKPLYSHLSDEKLGPGGLWRRDDGDAMGRDRDRDRERERERDRDRDREPQRERERDRRPGIDIMHPPSTSLHGPGSSSTIGYDRIIPSPFPPSSPRHQPQIHDSWDDSQPPPPPRPPLGSPGTRLPPPHGLSHHSRHSSLGSPSSTRRQAPPSPPQPHPSSHTNVNSNSGLSVFPSSPRSMPITPVPAGPGSIPPKSATSRPLSPVVAKMVSGAASSYPQDTNGDLPRGSRGGDLFGAPPGSSGSRTDVYAENGTLQRREPHEVRPVAISLSSVGGSTMDSPYSRDRRDRPY